MFFLFFLIWTAFAARLDIESAAAGLIVSAIVFVFVRVHMDYDIKSEYKVLRNLFLGFRYGLTVIREAAKANVAVLKIIFSRNAEADQYIMYFRVGGFKSDTSRVVLANSYTLAPGSVTVSLEGDIYCLHFLDRKFIEGVEDSPLIRQLKDMEK